MDWKIELPETEVSEGVVKCSFCSNSQVPADQVFGGPDVFICHDCVRFTATQVTEPDTTAPPENPRTCNFCQREQEFADAIFVANRGQTYVCTDCVTHFAQSLPGA